MVNPQEYVSGRRGRRSVTVNGRASRAPTSNGSSRTLSELERRCLDEGITITWQRHRILSVLAEAEAPMNVDEVLCSVRDDGDRIGRATINTMLRLLIEAGIVEMSYSRAGRRVFL